jgi:hypothetical protein
VIKDETSEALLRLRLQEPGDLRTDPIELDQIIWWRFSLG